MILNRCKREDGFGDRREAEGAKPCTALNQNGSGHRMVYRAKRLSTSHPLRHEPRRVRGSPELNVVQGARNQAPCKVRDWQAMLR